jgi:hypothetical protein
MTDIFDPQARHAPGEQRTTVRAAPPDPFAVLRGRMLVQLRPEWADRLVGHVYGPRSGLVLSGKGSAAKVTQLRRRGHRGVLLADPALYVNGYASKDQPFLTEQQGSVLSVLQDALDTQLARKADFAMSPTGCIGPEDSGSFKAAARTVAEFNDPRMIFTAPLSVTWLQDESLRQTISILGKVPGLKALILARQMDPLQGTVVANLCTLLAEVPNTAVLRTDIAAVGALAHGAVFTSFGNIASQRHLVPPTEETQTSKTRRGGPQCPHVLYPELMDFYLGLTIARKYSAVAPPLCDCGTCLGRPLDRFTTRATETEAIAHNIAIMTGWAAALDSPTARTDPRRWWRDQCAGAVGRYDEVNVRIQGAGVFEVPPQLAQWAATMPDSGSGS